MLNLNFDDRWWTDEQGRTGDQGVFQTRAYLGEHKVTVQHGGHETSQDVALDRDSAELILRLPSPAQ